MSDTEDATPNKFVKIGLAAKNDLDSDVDEFDHSVLAQNLQALSTIYDEIAKNNRIFRIPYEGRALSSPARQGAACAANTLSPTCFPWKPTSWPITSSCAGRRS